MILGCLTVVVISKGLGVTGPGSLAVDFHMTFPTLCRRGEFGRNFREVIK